MYLSLEKSPINIEFWEGMLVVCEHHLQDLNDPEHAEGGRLFNRDVDVAAGRVVSGLSYSRLVELEAKTNAMLRSGQPVDGEFWDLVLRKIHVEKAIVSYILLTLLESKTASDPSGQAQLHPRSRPQESSRAIQKAPAGRRDEGERKRTQGRCKGGYFRR